MTLAVFKAERLLKLRVRLKRALHFLYLLMDGDERPGYISRFRLLPVAKYALNRNL